MKKILPILFLVAAVGAAAWWWLSARRQNLPDETVPVMQVQATPLRMLAISRTLAAYGVVEASASGVHSVALAYDCVVKDVAVSVGSRVKSGDLLLTVEPAPAAEFEMNSALGAAALAEQALSAAQQRYDLKLATSDELRTAEQTARDARLKLESFKKRGMGGEARITAAEAGVVTRLDAQPGAVLVAGTGIVTLNASAHLQARLGIEAADGGSVLPGQRVTLTAVDRPDAASAMAQVGMVGASVDAATGALEARVSLPPEGVWFPGEHVRAEIELETRTALVAPRSAVLPDEGRQVLYTVENHKAVKHTVQIGISSGEQVEVMAEGLRAGDLVVEEGNYELADGMAVVLPGEAEAKP